MSTYIQHIQKNNDTDIPKTIKKTYILKRKRKYQKIETS